MVEIRIGRGKSLQDHLDVVGINAENYDCPHCPVLSDKRFVCIRHNGTMSVTVNGGITSREGGTINQFRKNSLCCKD